MEQISDEKEKKLSCNLHIHLIWEHLKKMEQMATAVHFCATDW